MFFEKKKTISDYYEKIRLAKYERIYQSLKDILKMEITSFSKDSKEEIDYVATCSAIKTKARLALDFVSDLDNNEKDKKN